MPHMPEKDPLFCVLVLTALRENGLAMGLTFALTWLRIQYDGKETKPWRQILEAALGALMVVGLTVKEFGFSIAWSFATAGFIGVLGVEQARQLGKRGIDATAVNSLTTRVTSAEGTISSQGTSLT